MTWFKVDDGFYDHPKVADLPDSAIALWTRAGSWCAKHLTDGRVPRRAIRRFCDDPDEGAKALVDAGMWTATAEGFEFHDWDVYQPSRDETEEKRAAHARRQAEYRERKRLEREQGQRATPASHAAPVSTHETVTPDVTSQPRDASRDASPPMSRDASVARTVMPPRPVPSRPVPTVVPTELREGQGQTLFPTPPTASAWASEPESSKPARLPDTHRFDEFWSAYPHKRDKTAAQKAWAKLVRESQRPNSPVDLDAIVAAAGHYRHSKEFVNGFPKYPATFLNKGSWETYASGPPVEPTPAATGGFDARAADFAALGERMRNGTNGALSLIHPTPPALTGGPDA